MHTTWVALASCLAVGCGAAGTVTSRAGAELGEARVGTFERVATYHPCISTQPTVAHYREVGGDRSLLVYVPRAEEDDAGLAAVRYRDTAATAATIYECAGRQVVDTNAAPVRVRLARDEGHAEALVAELRDNRQR